MSDKLDSFFGSKDPVSVLYFFEVFLCFPSYAPLPTAPFYLFTDFPFLYVVCLLVCFLYYTLIFVYDDKVIGVTYNLKRLSHPGPPMMLGPFRFYEDRFECFLGVCF